MKTRFLEPARDEFFAAVDFYEEQASGLGADFTAEVEQILATVAHTPHLGIRTSKAPAGFCCAGFPTTLSILSKQMPL